MLTNLRNLVAVARVFAATLKAQSPPATSGDAGGGWQSLQGTVIRATNVTLRFLIAQSFSVAQDGDLVGGPSWIDRDRFDIVATRARTSDAAFPMVRTLLEDRFTPVAVD